MGVSATWLRGLGADSAPVTSCGNTVHRDRRNMVTLAVVGALLGATLVPNAYACVPLGRCVSGVWASAFCSAAFVGAYALMAKEPTDPGTYMRTA
jgi:hypothetical protein